MANQGKPSAAPEEKKVNIMIAAGAIVIALVMAVISWQILPEAVETQPAFWDTGVPPIPKWFAVLFPFGMTVLFAVETVTYRKQAVLCCMGYILNILFWVLN